MSYSPVVAETTQKKIDQLLLDTPNLPSLAAVVDQVVTLIEQKAPVDQIADHVAIDQVLCAKVMRLANSAYFSADHSVMDVFQAVETIGLNNLHTLVVSAGLNSYLEDHACQHMNEFSLYTYQVAVTAAWLAEQTGEDRNLVYSIAMLHALGALVMSMGLPDLLQQIESELTVLPGQERIAEERAKLGFCYADVGAELTRLWHFPKRYPQCLLQAAEPDKYQHPDNIAIIIFIAAWKIRTGYWHWSAQEQSENYPADIADNLLPRKLVLEVMPDIASLTGLDYTGIFLSGSGKNTAEQKKGTICRLQHSNRSL